MVLNSETTLAKSKMLWRTHIRMANEILHRLGIPESSPEAASLREGIIAPDKWRDYPHHHGKARSIEKHIMKAREFFLNDNLIKAYFHLGVALHYIQDSYTSLSTLSKHHTHWEEQMDEAYFTDNLHGLVKNAFNNRPDRREEYSARLKLLLSETEGRESTIRLATMSGPGSFSYHHIWGKPYVDVNFALRASYLIAKSVLARKRCTKLQEELENVHREYETKLKEAEVSFANSILKSVKRRNEWEGRKQQNGVLQAIKNGFLTCLSKKHGFDARKKFGKYRQKKHLMKPLKKYEKSIEKTVAPHRYWYDYDIPKLNFDAIENELISVNEASKHMAAGKHQIRELISKNVISSHQIGNEKLVSREELINKIEQI